MSAIVLAALVIMWAVVLVPMFLRRHERTDELAGVHRFAGAMRVLSRRRPVPHGASAPPTPVERRAAAIGSALARAPRPVVRDEMAFRSATRRIERVAARRRGLAVMVGLVVASALLAVVVGGWFVWTQVLVDLLALAGLAQLRASALADRYVRTVPSAPARESARLTTAPVSPRVVPVSVAVSAPRPATAAADEVLEVVVAARPARQIVFDAVSATPIVEKPRVRKQVAPRPVKRVEAFHERAGSPPMPEALPLPVLDAVDSDPDTMTGDLELLDGIFDRASGE